MQILQYRESRSDNSDGTMRLTVGINHGYAEQRDEAHSGQDRVGHLEIHHTIQNTVQFKTYIVFISRIFHLIFWDHG